MGKMKFKAANPSGADADVKDRTAGRPPVAGTPSSLSGNGEGRAHGRDAAADRLGGSEDSGSSDRAASLPAVREKPVSTVIVDPKAAKAQAQALEFAIGQIKKKCGQGSIMFLGADFKANVQVIPTGVLSLDSALGVGGLPRGRIVEIF